MYYRIVNINELNIDEISKKVSDRRIEKASKFKSDDDKKRSIAVEYLLNEMIEACKDSDLSRNIDLSDKYIQMMQDVSTPVTLEYDEKGKPHIYKSKGEDKADAIQFALTHSGEYVGCIISEMPCGIDIERHSEKRDYEKIARRVLTENESELVNNRDDFYNIWTLKESVMKAVGIGLSLDMTKIDFSCSNGEWSTVVENIKYSGKVLDAPDGYSLAYVEMN